MTRLARYHALVDERDASTACVEDAPKRYALVQTSSAETWLCTFDTAQEAGEAHVGEDVEGWSLAVIVDLDTGDEYDASYQTVTTVTKR